jgi:hypothetical protein
MLTKDEQYRNVFLAPIRVCAAYRPAFGTSRGEEEISVSDFQKIYGSDPLYGWIGLDSPLMYAAHKAAGGMTSIYRQIGIGCERLVRAIIQDNCGLSDEEVRWSYDSVRSDGKVQTLTLDARLDRVHLRDAAQRKDLDNWIASVSKFMNVNHTVRGATFEVRQGYKSADAKRQNADLRFGLASYNEAYLPVVMVVSTQVSTVVIRRYRQNGLLVLTGSLSTNPHESTFAFFDSVIGYSLSDFFQRNASYIQREVGSILHSLLSPS